MTMLALKMMVTIKRMKRRGDGGGGGGVQLVGHVDAHVDTICD